MHLIFKRLESSVEELIMIRQTGFTWQILKFNALLKLVRNHTLSVTSTASLRKLYDLQISYLHCQTHQFVKGVSR